MKKSKSNVNQTNHCKKLTDDDLPKAMEMPSDQEEYDSNYEPLQVSQTSLKKKNNMKQSSQSNSTYNVEALRQKITEQAQRLGNLESYKVLLEQRIKQLVPNHNLPVTSDDLKNLPRNNKGQNLIQYYNTILNERDQNITQLRSELASFQKSTNFKSTNDSTLTLQNFPIAIENYPNEKLKDTYHKLHSFTADLFNEKEIILDSLRQETITNDEQRNYIEMLKTNFGVHAGQEWTFPNC